MCNATTGHTYPLSTWDGFKCLDCGGAGKATPCDSSPTGRHDYRGTACAHCQHVPGKAVPAVELEETTPEAVPAAPAGAYVPRHRDTVRPVDSYSAAVDPYRAPRHLASTPCPAVAV